MSWARSIGEALGAAGAALLVFVGALDGARALGGSDASYTEIAIFGIVAFLVSLFVIRKWGPTLLGERHEGPLYEGVISVNPGERYSVMQFPLAAGDEVRGSLAELRTRIIRVVVRSRKDYRRARKGEVTSTLKDWTGTSDTNWVTQPAPARDTYFFEFEQVGDVSGREIQVVLRKGGGRP